MWAQAIRKHMNCLVSAAVVLTLGAGLWLPAAHAVTTLDPQNPGNFTREGQQPATPGAVLRLTDTSSADRIVFFANDGDAAAGIETDVFATFQVIQAIPNNVDAGARIVINDGVTRAAVATCIVVNGVRGIGLLSTGQASDPTAYPVFVPVDWQNVTTMRLRRTAAGDAEIVEVNGVAPPTRALLPANQCAGKTRAGGTVEFGTGNIEAECTVEYAAFRSERVAPLAVETTTWGRIKAMYSADRP